MAEILDRESTSSPGSPMGSASAAYGAQWGGEADDDRQPLDAAGRGWLLEERRERRLVQFVWSRWDQWRDEEGRWHAQWKANRWRRAGLTGVVLQRPDRDRDSWGVYAPPGSARVAPAFNMAARLCRQLKANVWADPPTPEAVPAQAANDDAQNAAEFSGRFLRAVDTQPPVDLLARFRQTFDLASTYDSGFLLFELDPHGGGATPRQIEASPEAATVEDATHTLEPDPMDPEGAPLQVPRAGPFVLRYVRADGSLTDDPDEAALDWRPMPRALPLRPYQVRPTVMTTLDVESAEGLLVARYQTLGELRKKYPRVGELSFAALRRLVDFEPEHPTHFLPTGVRQVRKLTKEDLANRYGRASTAQDAAAEGAGDPYGAGEPVSMAGMLRRAAAESGIEGLDSDGDDDGRDPLDIPDDVHVFTLELFQRGETAGYPWGAHVCIAGGERDGRVLHRGELAGTRPVQGVLRKQAAPIPVAQCKQFSEGALDFYGVGAMTILGNGNEARAQFVMSLVEHLDRFNRRKVFYSPSSLFQPKAALGAMGTYIPVERGAEPRVEQVPDYPRAGVEMFSLSSDEMQQDLGLSPVAQGNTDPSVKSALHAATLIEQVVVNLSDVKQNAERFVIRSWRIVLALAWAHMDPRHITDFFGADQAFKAEDFYAADIGATREVKIQRGSFTMLAPSAKLQVAEYAAGLGLIDLEELRRIFGGNYGADLGVQDNPALLRVRRQLTRFWKGPPADWTPPQETLDPATGQPAMTPPSYTPFDRVPADLEPALMTPVTMAAEGQGAMGRQAGVPPAPLGGTAMLRARELGRALAEERFERMREQAPEWAALLVAEYDAMRRAAGIQFMEELIAQQQAQAAAEQQALQQQAELEASGREQELAADAERAELELAAEERRLALEAERGEQELAQRSARGALDLELAERRAALAERAMQARARGNGRRQGGAR